MSDAPAPTTAHEPCFHCSESAALSARICPRCQQSLLVDVVVRNPLRDPRAAYALARAIARLGVASSSLPELKRSLASPRARIATGVTRERAQAVLQRCREGGAVAETEPHRGRGGRVARRELPVAPIAVGVAIALVGIGLWLGSGRDDAGGDDESTAAEATDERATALSTAQIAEIGGASTVSLACGNQIGTGFFVTTEKLVTNAHVVCADDPAVEVYFENGKQITGYVERKDTKLDLALVDVPFANAVPLPLGDASLLRPGDKVVIIGTPHGMDHTVHEGSVSHVGRNLFGVAYVQVDANVNPGNSGGPLFNEAGELVGIVSLKAEGAEGIGFALPINYAYDAPTAILDVRPASPSWQQMLARAHEQELVERDRAATAFSKTALLAATLRGPNLYLIVLRRSSGYPGAHRIEVSFERNGALLCDETIYVSEWRTLEEVMQERDASELTNDIRWLREHDLTDDLWYGAGVLSLERRGRRGSRGGSESACATRNLVGAEVVAENAEENYDRVTVSVTGR